MFLILISSDYTYLRHFLDLNSGTLIQLLKNCIKERDEFPDLIPTNIIQPTGNEIDPVTDDHKVCHEVKLTLTAIIDLTRSSYN